MSARPDIEAISAAAARWVVRRNAGLSGPESGRLAQWLAADPRHRAAFEHYSRTWSAFEGPEREDAQGAVIRRIGARVKHRRQRRARGALAAAAACAVVVFAFAATLRFQHGADGAPPANQPASRVAVVQPERRTLEDGSVVDIMRGAVIDVRYDDTTRRVVLTGGEAHFQVAKGQPRPFVVEAGGMVARAVGTMFIVRHDAEQVEVLVTEGRVAVEKTPSPATDATAPAWDAGAVSMEFPRWITTENADSPAIAASADNINANAAADTNIAASANGTDTNAAADINANSNVASASANIVASAAANVATNASANLIAAAAPGPARLPLAMLGARERIVVKTTPAAAASAAPAPGGEPAPPPEVVELTPAEVNARLDWLVPRIEFTSTPLAEAVALINRLSRLPDGSANARLVLAPELEHLASEPVSGLFRADSIEAFVHLLGLNLDIEGERNGGEIILRRARRQANSI
ncbi:MAG: FecR domain-containing protein [Opitutaceae bacterium]|jgi:transmembrane sensor|nr:FecR domain-containing protein [Opitutaceae bacterium]